MYFSQYAIWKKIYIGGCILNCFMLWSPPCFYRSTIPTCCFIYVFYFCRMNTHCVTYCIYLCMYVCLLQWCSPHMWFEWWPSAGARYKYIQMPDTLTSELCFVLCSCCRSCPANVSGAFRLKSSVVCRINYYRYLNDNLGAPVFTEFYCSNKCSMLNGPTSRI